MFYKQYVRPLFFLFDPEKVHRIVIFMLNFFFKIPGLAFLLKHFAAVEDVRLEKELFGLHFKNRVGIAAGFDKNGEFFNELAGLGFGFIETGTVTPNAQKGNPKQRLFRLPEDKALINRMGFNNKGLETVKNNLGRRRTDAVIGVNLGKNSNTSNKLAVNDYVALFEGLFDVADYFVVNVSCPNINNLRELQDQRFLNEILSRIGKVNLSKPSPKPVLLKISPDLNKVQLDEVIEIVIKTGIAGVVAVNTTVSREGLKTSPHNVTVIGKGGLSGKPIRKRALEVVRYLSENSGNAFPIIGVGGIFTPDDALEMFAAGADLIQLYSGFVYEGPFVARKINMALLKQLKK